MQRQEDYYVDGSSSSSSSSVDDSSNNNNMRSTPAIIDAVIGFTSFSSSAPSSSQSTVITIHELTEPASSLHNIINKNNNVATRFTTTSSSSSSIHRSASASSSNSSSYLNRNLTHHLPAPTSASSSVLHHLSSSSPITTTGSTANSLSGDNTFSSFGDKFINSIFSPSQQPVSSSSSLSSSSSSSQTFIRNNNNNVKGLIDVSHLNSFISPTTPTPLFWKSTDDEQPGAVRWPPPSSTSLTTPFYSDNGEDGGVSVGYYSNLYCQALQSSGFSCTDSLAASPSEIQRQCIDSDDQLVVAPAYSPSMLLPSSSTSTTSAPTTTKFVSSSCIDNLLAQRNFLENDHLFYVYLYFATPLVIIAIIFNAIALASIVKLPHKLSRHLVLCLMSVSDTFVSLFAFIRRIDQTYNHGAYQLFLMAGWQMTWLLSALSLLGLAIDIFIALAKSEKHLIRQANLLMEWGLLPETAVTAVAEDGSAASKPYSYEKPFMKRTTCIAIAVCVLVAGLIVAFLAIFDLQYSDNSQYFACGVILVIIITICTSHLYACVSAERAQSKMAQSRSSMIMAPAVQQQLNATFSNNSKNAEGNKNSTNSSNSTGKAPSINRFLRKSIITTTLLIISSLLSWIPILAYFLIDEGTINANVPTFIRILTFCLVCFHMNAVVNPMIYSFRFRDVRSSLKRLFRSCFKCCPDKMPRLLSARNNSNPIFFKDHQSANMRSNRRSPSPSTARCTDEGKLEQHTALLVPPIKHDGRPQEDNNDNNNNNSNLVVSPHSNGCGEKNYNHLEIIGGTPSAAASSPSPMPVAASPPPPIAIEEEMEMSDGDFVNSFLTSPLSNGTTNEDNSGVLGNNKLNNNNNNNKVVQASPRTPSPVLSTNHQQQFCGSFMSPNNSNGFSTFRFEETKPDSPINKAAALPADSSNNKSTMPAVVAVV